MVCRLVHLSLGLAALAISSPVWAHGETAHREGIGQPGEAGAVARDISIVMLDNEFQPEVIEVRAGQTVRFTIENAGEFVHEFNIGTPQMHAAHQDEMMMMMENGVLEADRINHHMMGGPDMMSHDDPNSVLLEPGETDEIIWTFSSNETLQFGCNVPGHYEGGMVGEFEMM